MTSLRLVDAHYRELSQDWRTVDRTDDYKALVTASDNAERPFHRWFHMKEAFSHRLLAQLKLDEAKDTGLTDWSSVLDPFAGSGTTMLSAVMGSLPAARVAGVERNPALETIARAKVRGWQLGSSGIAQLERDADTIDFDDSISRTTPSATLSNADYFNQASVSQLLHVAEQIDAVDNPDSRTILTAVLAAMVESVGRLRRDGRALRFDKGRAPVPVQVAFKDRLGVVVDDMRGVPRPPQSTARLSLGQGDARDLAAHDWLGDESYNRIVFSPPYPNNIDYTEVYKLENWVIGSWADAEAMKVQRLSTLRSHPSVLFPEHYEYEASEQSGAIESLVAPLIECIPADRYERGRQQLIRGYADDMWRVLQSSRARASERSRLYCIVGNSVHGDADAGFVVAADVLIAALGRYAGWTPVEIRVARRLTRRSVKSEYVRESVVVLEPATK